ncbi:MAG: hypothetical protein P8X64_13860 [Anaerolineales bacterium]
MQSIEEFKLGPDKGFGGIHQITDGLTVDDDRRCPLEISLCHVESDTTWRAGNHTPGFVG